MENQGIIGHTSKNGLLEFFNLMAAKGALGVQDMKDYTDGKKVFYTADLYVRKFIGASMTGNVDVITENEVEYINRCNLSKGRIPAEMNIIASHIDIKYGEALTSAALSLKPENIDYINTIYDLGDLSADAGRAVIASTTVFARRIPTSFTNAEYELQCDNGLVAKGRVSEFLIRNTVSNTPQGGGENKSFLMWPKLLPADKTLRLSLKFPATATADVPASTDFFVEFSVKGIYLGKRPNA